MVHRRELRLNKGKAAASPEPIVAYMGVGFATFDEVGLNVILALALRLPQTCWRILFNGVASAVPSKLLQQRFRPSHGIDERGRNRQEPKLVMSENTAIRLPLAAGIFAAAAVIAALASGASAQSSRSAAAKEAGIWYDDTGKGAVEIFPCADKLCGRIVWLKEPVGKDGQPLNDGYNPNPSMRSRTICGLQILGNLTRQSDGTLDGGWVYDPKVGKSYDAAISLEDRNNLTLTGYKGVKLLSKSFTWTRAPAKLPSCNMMPASAPAGTAKPAPAKPTAAR